MKLCLHGRRELVWLTALYVTNTNNLLINNKNSVGGNWFVLKAVVGDDVTLDGVIVTV